MRSKRVASWILTRPTDLPEDRREHLDQIIAACPEMTDIARLVREFAELMTEHHGEQLDSWIKQVHEAGPTELGPFLTGLEQDHAAAVAGQALPYNNGPDEGVNTKLIKRQMYGSARFPRSRHRILLGSTKLATTEFGTEPVPLTTRRWDTSSALPRMAPSGLIGPHSEPLREAREPHPAGGRGLAQRARRPGRDDRARGPAPAALEHTLRLWESGASRAESNMN